MHSHSARRRFDLHKVVPRDRRLPKSGSLCFNWDSDGGGGGSMAGDRPESGEVPLLYSEGNVAARVALEREVRGWSTTELAERVTRAGIKMNQTAVWRI